MDHLTITEATPGDLDALVAIARTTYIDSFASLNTGENMAKYLAENLTREKLSAELDNPHSVFFFARHAGEVIGYLKLNTGPAQTEQQDSTALEIERIYAHQAWHGKGIGQLLLDKALAVARDRQASFVWLGVWEKNPRAIRFYDKNRFKPFGRHVFMMGDDPQTDILMRRELILPTTP